MRAATILANLEMKMGTSSARTIRAIWFASDNEGTIQAEDMLRLFPGHPQLHSTSSMLHALIAAGCEDLA